MNHAIAISPVVSEWFSVLLERRRLNGVEGNEERLWNALADAHAMYGDQVHRLGERLIDHCVGVLRTMSQFDLDDSSVIACLFHHVLDTKLWSLDDIEEKYGSDVRNLIAAAHLLSRASLRSRMSVDSLRLMFLKVSDDMRAVILILCNHVHVLENMVSLDPRVRRNIATDTLELFAPVAARLGIYSLKHRMETVAFPLLYSVDAERISEQLADIHTRYGDFLGQTATVLKEQLKMAGIASDVYDRQKQPYSLFKKMHGKNLNSVQDVYDLFAIRVIVDSEDICYQALGTIHRLGHPVANRFKDYIAFPKPNGYRSLHTTLVQVPGAPEDAFIEVQIRTKSMHRDANLGIAAHWSYKEGGVVSAKRKAALQELLVSGDSGDGEVSMDPQEEEHIFALTPGGDIIELPEGATPLDFAFSIHTMIGLSFKSAKVNGAIAAIDYVLENGDIVEIVRSKDPKPSHGWMQYLKTGSARARLKRYLIEQDRPLLIQQGKEKLNAELARLHLPQLDTDLSILRLFDGEKQAMADRESILMKIGQEAQSALWVLQHLDAVKDMVPLPTKRVQKRVVPSGKSVSGLQMEESLRLPHRYALCCKPDQGQKGELSGIVGRDGYVRIHRAECAFIKKSNPERQVDVWWE